MITEIIRTLALELAGDGGLPAFLYDMGALREHVAGIQQALAIPAAPEIFYAAKANPDAPILRTVAPYVDGIEVASGGELQHVRRTLPDARISFGGPGKTDSELALVLQLNVERVHVESPHELSRLAAIAHNAGREVDVLLRVNLAGERKKVAVAMSGPFGMDSELIDECLPIMADAPWVRLRGIHAHLASGLAVADLVRQSTEILDWGRDWLAQVGFREAEFNLGGGMAVDYADPTKRFDWSTYAKDVAALARPGETLRIEPGWSITVYAGWYVTEVLDIKKAHGRWYAVLRGGTMHFRTPVTREHNQPFVVLGRAVRTSGTRISGEPVTLVGQLCTPKDVFASAVPVNDLKIGDVVAFSMAGAYAWNISHYDFLMHPKPGFHYVER